MCLPHFHVFKKEKKRKSSFYFKSFNMSYITRKPVFAGPLPTLAKTKKAIWRNLLSIQNEAISLVAMHSKELWLVHQNRATVKLDSSVASRGMKTYSESRIELQNRTSQVNFCHKSSPVSRIAWKLPWILQAELNKYVRETCGCGQTGGHLIRVWMKGALLTVEICVLCGWWFSNQFEIVSETPFSCDTVGRER